MEIVDGWKLIWKKKIKGGINLLKISRRVIIISFLFFFLLKFLKTISIKGNALTLLPGHCTFTSFRKFFRLCVPTEGYFAFNNSCWKKTTHHCSLSPPLSLSLSLIYRVMCNRIKRGEGGGFISIPRRVDFHSFRRIIHGAVSLFPQRYILNSFNLRTVYFHDLWPRSFPILLFYTNIKIIFHDIYWISTSSKKLGRNKNISFLRFIETVVQLRNRKKLG